MAEPVACLAVANLTNPLSLQEAAKERSMRWVFTGALAAVFTLAVVDMARACGCCGCCAGRQGGGCPNCPGGGAGGSCPNCPGQAASYEPSRYWSSAYGCYLYYDPATRLSYYWSEPHHSYFPVRSDAPDVPASPATATAPRSSPSSGYATRYYNPGPVQGMNR